MELNIRLKFSAGFGVLIFCLAGACAAAQKAETVALDVADTAQVEAPSAQTPSIALVAPSQVQPGQSVTVGWQGQGDDQDVITIARPDSAISSRLSSAKAQRGRRAQLAAPTVPGTYQLRYLRGDTLLASLELDVRSYGVNAPARSEAGSSLSIGNIEGEMLLARPDDNRRAFVSQAGSLGKLVLPLEPGRYELRQRVEDRIVWRQTLQVTAAAARLLAPDFVITDNDFEVTVEGPQRQGDRVVLRPWIPGDASTSGMRSRFVGEQDTVAFTAPSPGEYELLYVSGDETLATNRLRVVAATEVGTLVILANQDFTITTLSGRPIANGSPVTPQIDLPPGEYLVRIGEHSVQITIYPGAATTIEL